MTSITQRLRRSRTAIAAGVAFIAAISAACGSGDAKPASSNAATSTPIATDGGQGLRGGNRTPSPDRLTSIAEGTPFGFGNRTPSPDMLTSIAQGTPFGPRDRTPSAADQTAIAQGTPAQSLRAGFFSAGAGGGGGRAIADVALILAITEDELRTALQSPTASLERIAAEHGVDRPTLRQKLIDATQKRLSDQVAAGSLTQDLANQALSQFTANIDNLLDRVGGAFPAPSPTP